MNTAQALPIAYLRMGKPSLPKVLGLEAATGLGEYAGQSGVALAILRSLRKFPDYHSDKYRGWPTFFITFLRAEK